MAHMNFDDPISIKDQVRTQNDIQILTYESDELSKFPSFPYDPEEVIASGMPVYIYDFDTPYTGRVYRVGKRPDAKIAMDESYPAAGNSGSPVVSGMTGNVIGVVLSADSPEDAKLVGFEILNWDGKE